MANKVIVVQNSREVSNMADKELNLSEEEQALLKEIRDEREHISREIQVSYFLSLTSVVVNTSIDSIPNGFRRVYYL